MTPDLPQELEPEVVILSSVCGKHFDDDCPSCALAKQSNDERVTRTPAVATDEQGMGLIADALETARHRAVVLFNGYALGVSMQHGRGEEQFKHDVATFNEELTEALRAPISTRTIPAQPSSVATDEGVVERVRAEMHKRYPKHDSMAMQGASNNAMHYSIEADARRMGADDALDAVLAAIQEGVGEHE